MGEQILQENVLPTDATVGKAAHNETARAENQLRWSNWIRLPLDPLPLPYFVSVVIAGAIVLSEQLYEQTLASGSLNAIGTNIWVRRLVLPVLTIYMLSMLKFLKTTAVHALAELRPVVQIDDRDYDELVHRMVHMEMRVELGLLAASATVVVIWFILLGNPFLVGVRLNQFSSPLGTLFVYVIYVFFGWAGLMLITSTLQSGRALGGLAQRPLAVNVFDSGNLIPFGSIALIHSLSAAGVILVLLIGLGQPTDLIDWIVILLATSGSLGALVYPLLGVRHQMRQAKFTTLWRIYEQLKQINDTLLARDNLEAAELAEMMNRTVALTNLRKTILEAPNWPFRDSATAVRAVTAALSPLIYFILIEIMRVYFLPILKP